MAQNNFTQGQWIVSGIRYKIRDMSSDFPIQTHLVGPDGDPICYVLYNSKHHAEMLANARLISAAPDLLAALKAMLESAEVTDVSVRGMAPWDPRLQAWEALKKAGGS